MIGPMHGDRPVAVAKHTSPACQLPVLGATGSPLGVLLPITDLISSLVILQQQQQRHNVRRSFRPAIHYGAVDRSTSAPATAGCKDIGVTLVTSSPVTSADCSLLAAARFGHSLVHHQQYLPLQRYLKPVEEQQSH